MVQDHKLWTLLLAHTALAGPPQVQLHLQKPSFLNMACLFKLPSIYTDSFLSVTNFNFFFLLVTHMKCHWAQEALWIKPVRSS